MASINGYLTFNGNCRQAMQFYQRCIGGTLSFQTVADTPHCTDLPPVMQKAILHATLKKDGLILMASDLVGSNGRVSGNTVSLLLNCDSKTEMYRCYRRLSLNGNKTHPIKATWWGAMMGDLTDQFGFNWLLYYVQKTG